MECLTRATRWAVGRSRADGLDLVLQLRRFMEEAGTWRMLALNLALVVRSGCARLLAAYFARPCFRCPNEEKIGSPLCLIGTRLQRLSPRWGL